jgi:hypothetical protein
MLPIANPLPPIANPLPPIANPLPPITNTLLPVTSQPAGIIPPPPMQNGPPPFVSAGPLSLLRDYATTFADGYTASEDTTSSSSTAATQLAELPAIRSIDLRHIMAHLLELGSIVRHQSWRFIGLQDGWQFIWMSTLAMLAHKLRLSPNAARVSRSEIFQWHEEMCSDQFWSLNTRWIDLFLNTIMAIA